MTLAGVTASWCALILAVLALLAALAASPERSHVRDLAIRALAVSALASLSAGVVLGDLLAQAQLDAAFVAGHVTRNMALFDRIATLWSAPAGSAIPAAALVAGLGAFCARRRRESLGVAVSAATVLALAASSVAAEPFQRLTWQPAEGLGVLPWVIAAGSLLGRVSLMGAIAAASVIAARAADDVAQERGQRHRTDSAPYLTTLIALITVGIVSSSAGAYSAGGALTPAPTSPFARFLDVALVTTALATRAQRGNAMAALLGGVGVLATLVGGLLLNGASTPATPLLAFCSVAVIAAAGGSLMASRSAPNVSTRWAGIALDAVLAAVALALLWKGGDESAILTIFMVSAIAGTAVLATAVWRELSLRRPSAPLLLLLALAATALAALGERTATTRALTLRGGERVSLQGEDKGAPALTHQGVSQYDRPTGHVVALAVGVESEGRARLVVTERRDYVDTRQNPIATGVARPAVMRVGLSQLRVVLDSVGADERVGVRATLVPFAWGWVTGAVLTVVAAIISWVARSLHHSINTVQPIGPHPS